MATAHCILNLFDKHIGRHYANNDMVLKVIGGRFSAFVTGLVIGVGAALAQAFLGVAPPVAYGICMVGHARDLVTWIMNHILGTRFEMQTVSLEIPVLTVIGVLTGSAIASFQRKEFKAARVRNPVVVFVLGFLIVNFALVLGACPLRAIVYASYGNIHMITGFLFIVAGVIAGVEYIRRRPTSK